MAAVVINQVKDPVHSNIKRKKKWAPWSQKNRTLFLQGKFCTFKRPLMLYIPSDQKVSKIITPDNKIHFFFPLFPHITTSFSLQLGSWRKESDINQAMVPLPASVGVWACWPWISVLVSFCCMSKPVYNQSTSIMHLKIFLLVELVWIFIWNSILFPMWGESLTCKTTCLLSTWMHELLEMW